AVLLSRLGLDPYLKGRTEWDRTTFEQEVHREALLEPSEATIGGEMFRGDSYGFVLLEAETSRPFFYDQTSFARFDIEDEVCDWRLLEIRGKRDALREWGVAAERAE